MPYRKVCSTLCETIRTQAVIRINRQNRFSSVGISTRTSTTAAPLRTQSGPRWERISSARSGISRNSSKSLL